MKDYGKKRMFLESRAPRWFGHIERRKMRDYKNIYYACHHEEEQQEENKGKRLPFLEDQGLEDGTREKRLLWKLKTVNS